MVASQMRETKIYKALVIFWQIGDCTDYGHPERAFFQNIETFGLGQTNWAGIL